MWTEIFENLTTLAYMLAMLGVLIFINTLLGSINAWNFGEWKTKKFITGILKNLLIALCVALFFIVIEFIPVVLARTGIIIPGDVVTIVEVFGMIAVAIKKYVTDIYSGFLDILGIKKEDVAVVVNAKEDKG